MSYTDFDFPHTRMYESDLREILARLKDLTVKINNFISLNTVKYADPILWNITSQYESNTIVVDSNGTAYLSTQPVPAGVSLDNTEYWTVIFDLSRIISAINQNITFNDADTSQTATFASSSGDWLLWNSVLYKVIADISIGSAYVPDANIEKYSIEEFFNELVSTVNTTISNFEENVNTNISNFEENVNTNISNFEREVNTKIENIKVSFSTVADMLASDKITAGEVYRCDGYYNSGDRGVGFWSASSTADSVFSLQCDNGLYVKPISFTGVLNVYQFGAYGNDTNDDREFLQYGIDYCRTNKIALFIDAGTFAINECLNLTGRLFKIYGAGMENTNIHRVSANGIYNYCFRFTDTLQWGISISDMTLYNDGGGSCFYFSDGTSGGDVYHATFKNLQLKNAAYGFIIPDGASTTPWWGSIFENIIFSSITIQCIHMGGTSVGIPNNSYIHITTYSCGANASGVNAQFYLKGYNQVLENIEILSSSQCLLEILDGGNVIINGLKCEALTTAAANFPLIKLGNRTYIKATELSLVGDFTNVSAIFAYSGTDYAHFDIDILRIGIRAGTSMAVSQICSSSRIDGAIGEIFNIISSNPLPYSWSNDINVNLKSLNNNKCIGIASDTTIDPLTVSKVRSAATCTLTVNITSDDRNRYAANLDITIAAVSTNTITVVLGSDTIGTVTNGTKHLIVQGGYGYLI